MFVPYTWTCVCACAVLLNGIVGSCKREDGPTRPDGNKRSSVTREEVTGRTQAK